MGQIYAVVFDVDGVLLDSLMPHLQICKDMNRKYDLGLVMPSVNDFKKMVSNGVKISPMKYFFKAVGFPNKYADLAFEDYKAIFMRDYSPKPFSQVENMLFKLSQAGLKLGIVTSNVRANVDSALGDSMHFFYPGCIFTKEDMVNESKVSALFSVSKHSGVGVSSILYVGDQPADWAAAKEAGVKFLGVTYGWGISEENKDFPTVKSVEGIAEYIFKKNGMLIK